MRTIATFIIVLFGLLLEARLLSRESTHLWQLTAVGSVVGLLAGYAKRGQRGIVLGLLIGCGMGLLAPWLYLPFWAIFTLPPHPTVDM